MIVLDIKNIFSVELAVKEAALNLFKNKVIVFPTDTLYALGVNALNADDVRRVFLIKQRPATKPMPIMVNSLNMAKALAVIDEKRERILKYFWPGAFTFVLKKKSLVPNIITAGQDSVALRLPDNYFCKSLLDNFEGPITATSANISGENPYNNSQDIIKSFTSEQYQPDVLVDAGVLPAADPSTVIDLTANAPKILRINPTTKEKLLEILKAFQI